MHIFLDERDKELIDGQIDELTNNVSELKSDLNDLEGDLSSVIDFGNPLKINRLDDGVFSFNEQDGYYIQSQINTQRVSCDTSDMGIIVGDVIGFEDYSTYQFAIGENSAYYSWLGGGYKTSDVTITEENIIHAKGILFKRNDNADLTSQDKENIINMFGSKTRSNHIKIKDNKPLRNYVHISFDDIVRCFEDLATNKDTYNSIFDSEFFGGLKNLHDKYGAKFSLYCYDISSYVSTIGNKFADDFNNASDWLKFGFHLYSQGKNLAGYNAFLNDIFTLGMTFNSIDRLPRLDGFGGSLSDILAMRDTDCGIIGLLTTDDSRVSWNEDGKVWLLTFHKCPDSYVEGSTFTTGDWYMWTVTDGEIIEWYINNWGALSDWSVELNQLLGMPLNSGNTHISAVWVDVNDVIRPAYQTDPTKQLTAEDLDGSSLGEYEEWFNSNILSSYFSSWGQYPWTRLGYTYDWGAEDEYGLTEFLVLKNSTIEVEFTKTIDEFFDWLYDMAMERVEDEEAQAA